MEMKMAKNITYKTEQTHSLEMRPCILISSRELVTEVEKYFLLSSQRPSQLGYSFQQLLQFYELHINNREQ